MTYSASAALSRQRFTSRNQNSVTLVSSEKRLGPITNTVVIIVLSCLLGMLYITQVTHTNSLSYKIDDLQKKQTSLKSEREELEATSAMLQSIKTVQSSKTVGDLVSVTPSGTVQN